MSDYRGLKRLMNKSLSIAVAALSSLQSVQAKSLEVPESMDYDYTDSSNANKLKPKLVLKLNMSNPEEGHMLLMHRSHSSHSSHRSHSSHYSSSYSSGSSSSYSPQTTPSTIYTPSNSSSSTYNGNTSTRVSNSVSTPVKKPTATNSEINTLYNTNYEKTTPSVIMTLGDRELYKGCQGTDVEELQKLLAELGYDIIISEYFGDRTEKAVIQFQKDNELKPDGRVGEKTLILIKRKS